MYICFCIYYILCLYYILYIYCACGATVQIRGSIPRTDTSFSAPLPTSLPGATTLYVLDPVMDSCSGY